MAEAWRARARSSVVNLFLGWTFIGWVVALAMAARSVPGTAAVEGGHSSFRLTK